MSNVAIGATPYELMAPLRLEAKCRRKEACLQPSPRFESLAQYKWQKPPSALVWEMGMSSEVFPIEGAENDCRNEQTRSQPVELLDRRLLSLARFVPSPKRG